jgi:beta-exotoxin I transport system permease protein
MNTALLLQTWRFQRLRLSIVCAGLAVWGALLPVIYARFGSQFRMIEASGILPAQAARFGGGDIFSLPGAIALAVIHPISIILISVFAVDFPSAAVAGERQRGTLEVVLARPISRRTLYITLAIAALSFIAAAVTSLLAGALAGSAWAGVIGEVAVARVPILWVNAVLLFGSFAAIGLAASVSLDRLAPAFGATLGIVIVMYVLDVLGSLWPAAEPLQPYSLFHYMKAKPILTGTLQPSDLVLLLATIAAAVLWALIVFPRRDLAAPS